MRQITALFVILFFCITSAFAQNKVIGKVIDSKDGSPISGISVKVVGSTIGTSTSPDGTFSLNVSSATVTLEFTGATVSPKTISAIADGKTILITLEPDTKSLSDIVVTALGIKREKRSLGYATQTIGGENVNNLRTGNVLSELSGKVSGLTVINSAGDPGAGTYVLLRGSTSIDGNNQPLLVVDGIPIDNSINNFDPQNAGVIGSGPNSALLGGAQPTNRGLDINPSDIESITVLKGPEASALYGIRAASGALIITTKKGGGSGGTSTIALNSSVAFDNVGRLPPLQNQYAQGDGGIYAGPETGTSISWGPAIDTLSWNGDPTYKWDKHGAIVGRSDPSAVTPVTPYDQYAFFKTGVTYDNNIALSGSTAKGSYRLSLGNLYQTGIIPKSKYVKTTFSINGNSKLSDKLGLSGGMTYINSINDKVEQGSSTAGLMLGLTRTPPTFDNSNGFSDGADNPLSYSFPDGSQRSYRGGGGYDNPYWVVNKDPYTSDVDRVIGFGQVDYQALNWLSFTYRLGGDVYAQSDKNSFDIGSNSNGLGGAGAVYLFDYANKQFNSDFIVNAKKAFTKDFSGSILLGHNYFTQYTTTRAFVGTSLGLPGFLDISNAASVSAVPGEGELENKYRTRAFYTDVEFSYKRMLYLGITGRDEESSTLPANNNTFFYPSASASWIFSELKELKKNKILSFGKLRFSAAQVGKDAPIYALTTLYKSASFADGFTGGISFPVSGVPGYQISSGTTVVGNPDLKPEQTNSYEGGVDVGVLKDRISLSATVYYSRSKDVIFQVPLPFSSGFAAKNINGAVIDNNGVELSLNTTPVKLDNGLRWDLNINWSVNKSMVVSLAPGINNIRIGGFGGGEAEVDVIAGQPYGVLYGNTTLHAIPTNLKSPLIIDDAVADGSNYGQPLPFGPGPLQIIGNTNPKWIGSVTSNLTYMGFTFGFQIDVKHGGDVWNGTRGALANKGTAKETANRGTPTTFSGLLGHLDAGGNIVHYAPNGITELPGPGGENNIPSVYDENYWQNIQSSFGGGQETDVENGGFTKLRQISLTYQLPTSLVSKAGFTGLSLTIFANNIYTWTNYDGVDPETNLSGPANGQGLDYFNNPSTKSYGIRLNLGL